MMFSGVYAFLLIWSIFVYKYSVFLLCLMQRHEIFVLLFCFVLFPVIADDQYSKILLPRCTHYSVEFIVRNSLTWFESTILIHCFHFALWLVWWIVCRSIASGKRNMGRSPDMGQSFFSLETRQVDLILTFCLCKTLLIEQEGQLIRRITLQRFRFEQQLIPKDN